MHDQDLAHWLLLSHSVEDLFLRGKRTQEEIDAFKRAMQLFKEGQLEGVVTKGLPPDADLAQIFAFFDQPVESVGLIEEAVVLLRGYGVRYVGEILRFKWQFGFKGGENVHQLFLRRHIPVSTDPWSLGWRPAYLSDPAVRAALMLPGTLLFRSFSVWDPHPLRCQEAFNGHFDHTTPFVGQSIAKISKGNGEIRHQEAKNVQDSILRAPAIAAVLHAAMFIPEDYEDARDAESIPEVVAYVARDRRARALLEAECGDSWNPMDHRELRPVWRKTPHEAEAEGRRRSRVLAAALRAEGMSPHFFAVATRLDRHYFRETKTVREFLSKTYGTLGHDWNSGRAGPNHLAAWGLKLGMTKEELDDLFGPETDAEGTTAMA